MKRGFRRGSPGVVHYVKLHLGTRGGIKWEQSARGSASEETIPGERSGQKCDGRIEEIRGEGGELAAFRTHHSRKKSWKKNGSDMGRG